jgi:tetratricopeptide (TPR) repeat protein
MTLAAVFIARKLLEPVQIQALRTSAPSVPLPAPSAERESEYVAGRIVGEYRLVRMISADDVGSYWEAQALKGSKPVGLKLARNSDATIAKRLYAEAAKAKPLTHPHILRVHEVGTETDKKGSLVHFLVTDLVEGKSLGDLVGHANDFRTVARHFEAAAEALHYAHGQNVLHTNLKPSNILIARDGRLLLLYCDLGVRRDETRVFRERGTLQNAPYLAPEQCPGNEAPPDPRTDVYRLGVLLYEVTTGRQPYSGLPSDVARKILETKPTPPRQIKPSIDAGLEAIILRAMEKDRELRFPTASEMAHALHRFARSEVRQVDIAHGELKIGAGAHARKWWQRNARRVVAAVVLLALAVPAGLYVARWLRWRFSEERRQDLEARYRELVESARRALAEGQYSRALMDAEEALKHRFTEDMAVVAQRARTALAELALAEGLEAVRAGSATPDTLRTLERALEVSAELPPASRTPQLLAAEGRALRALGRRDEAEARLQQAISGGAVDAATRLALAHILVERWIEASLVDQAMPVESEISDRAAAWVRQAADHLRSAGDTPLSDVEAGVCRAFTALTAGDPEAASRVCEEEIVRLGTRAGTEAVLLAAAFAARDPNRRLKFLNAAVERRPGAAFPLLMRGATHAAAGRITEAAGDFDAALASRSAPACAHLLRGLAWLRVRDADRALADLDPAAKLDTAGVDVLNARAVARLLKNDTAGALADADAACGRCPEHRGTRLNRARVRLAAGKPDLAAQDCDWIIDRHADYAHAYVVRGFARFDVRDPDGASRDFEKVIQLDADHPGGWGGRAVVRLALGDARGALADGEKSLKLAAADWPERKRVEAAVEAARKK